ncbi:hypothetical protein B0H14DRAFT_3134900 [Mycena olivaceomarginata]|nr:hypothetical protein B0H14DRAFT_3134900 [Mycena olivaceomarginata]
MRQFQVPTFISHLVPVILISALVCLLLFSVRRHHDRALERERLAIETAKLALRRERLAFEKEKSEFQMDKAMKSRRTHNIDTALEQERLMVETEKLELGRERLALERERSEFDRGDARLARLIELVLKWSLQSGEVQPVPRPFPEPSLLVETEYQFLCLLVLVIANNLEQSFKFLGACCDEYPFLHPLLRRPCNN